MKMAISMVIFAIVFISIYFGMHYYVLSRLAGMFKIPKDFYFWIGVAILSLSYILAMFLERSFSNKLTQIMYFVSAVWMGLLFLTFFLLLIYEIVSRIWAIPTQTSAIYIVIAASVLTIFAVVNASFVQTSKVQIEIGGVKQPLRIVQLSDIHIGTIHHNAYLDKIVKETNSLNPDVVLITGDLFDGSAPIEQDMLSPIQEIKAPVYFVTGNHETYEGIDKVSNILKNTKIIWLRNEVANFRGIQIVGIDYGEGKGYLDSALSSVSFNKSHPSILMFHAPAPEGVLSKNNISLHLAGHTHKGQIFPFTFFVWLAYKYPWGLHREGNSAMYISQGTGTWGPPMRLGTRSEITLLELKPRK